ncbi:MAG TPA: hypothetical protein VGS80_19320 [Ktedonobacterales bacterium]|nr:hypothetical protein [Ktedonobacterales bacterium]
MSTKHHHNEQHSSDSAVGGHTHRQLGPLRDTTDPYPYVFSSDVFDRRRFGVPGRPYGPAGNRLPRAATRFAIVVIALFVALSLLTLIQSLIGP